MDRGVGAGGCGKELLPPRALLEKIIINEQNMKMNIVNYFPNRIRQLLYPAPSSNRPTVRYI